MAHMVMSFISELILLPHTDITAMYGIKIRDCIWWCIVIMDVRNELNALLEL